MGEIININHSEDGHIVRTDNDLIEFTEGILFDARADLGNNDTVSVPIAELAALGAAVSSLIPALQTVTQTVSVSTEGLYKLANAGGLAS